MNTNYNQHIEMFKLLTHEGDGILSTISVDVEGYPFGSTTPYCLDADFIPNILISGIAQHTKNIKAYNKVSLLMIERNLKTNKQAQGRLTYIGEAIKVENDEDIKKRYLNYFPSSKDYFKTHDFSFFKINPVRIRYIGGFGKIYWIEKDSLLLRNIFGADEEDRIVTHMNEDHKKSLKDYARYYLGHVHQEEDSIRMCGLDQFGVDLSVNDVKRRIDFEHALGETSKARSVFVDMAKKSSH